MHTIAVCLRAVCVNRVCGHGMITSIGGSWKLVFSLSDTIFFPLPEDSSLSSKNLFLLKLQSTYILYKLLHTCTHSACLYTQREKRGREGEREREKEGERVGGREGGREGRRERERERGRERRGREGGREEAKRERERERERD